MELKAVYSAKAMNARTASCSFGNGDSVQMSDSGESGWLSDPLRRYEGGLPRDVGGLVGKVW